MKKVKCKKCGFIGYSSYDDITCRCGGSCTGLPSSVKEEFSTYSNKNNIIRSARIRQSKASNCKK